MKKLIYYQLILLMSLILYSCGVNDSFVVIDTTPPAIPTGITVLNGDSRVDLAWNNNYDNDLAGYNVYYSDSYDGKYTIIGSTTDNYFIDYGASNGVTTYYAVTAYDYNGNESELSFDVIYAIPRPEGFNQSIFDYRKYPDLAGYTFNDYSVVPYDDLSTDFFFENYQGTYYIDVWDDTDIQDMGPTQDIWDIAYAPNSGWNPTKDAIAKVGHTYVIWTWDNHYAKVRVSNITSTRIVFDWSFQLVEGEHQLKPRKSASERHELTRPQTRKVAASVTE
jgi:hypothetical protein